MRRKPTALEQLRKENPSVKDPDLFRILEIVNGDVKRAIDLLRQQAIPPIIEPDNSHSPVREGLGEVEAGRCSFSDFAAVTDSWRKGKSIEPCPRPTIECACCIDDVALEEATFCSGLCTHWFCFDCARRYAENEIGNARFNLVCFDSSGCAAPFSQTETKRFLDSKLLGFLDSLKTNYEIQQAGLEGLVHCPFCPFAAIMEDPTDYVFECANCGIASCRYCRVKSHNPMSCEKYQASRKLNAKHLVEEAMTDALIRRCNNCGKPFVKEEGCNKMTCSCGNRQCFVCSQDIEDYSHFDDGGCPMYGDMKDLLSNEVAAAQESTLQQILQNTADLKYEDIRIDPLVLDEPSFRATTPEPIEPYREDPNPLDDIPDPYAAQRLYDTLHPLHRTDRYYRPSLYDQGSRWEEAYVPLAGVIHPQTSRTTHFPIHDSINYRASSQPSTTLRQAQSSRKLTKSQANKYRKKPNVDRSRRTKWNVGYRD